MSNKTFMESAKTQEGTFLAEVEQTYNLMRNEEHVIISWKGGGGVPFTRAQAVVIFRALEKWLLILAHQRNDHQRALGSVPATSASRRRFPQPGGGDAARILYRCLGDVRLDQSGNRAGHVGRGQL